MTPRRETGRFAPSTTGPAHPGTLLAALLCWLDARSRGARLVLRMEDLDPERSHARWREAMESDLRWLGIDWDDLVLQNEARRDHERALDRLEAAGRLYPCRCTRREIRQHGRGAEDGGIRYPGTCRARALPDRGWRAAADPLRVRLDPGRIALHDESGDDLSQDPDAEMGDPVVLRRDGAVAYHLASVVDDACIGVTRVVRGRDLAATTATQVALQRLLDLPTPHYRHHLLLLEEQGGKLAKLHGAVGADALRSCYASESLCGLLAHAAGLLPRARPIRPRQLLDGFDWARVEPRDRVLRWTGRELVLAPPSP